MSNFIKLLLDYCKINVYLVMLAAMSVAREDNLVFEQKKRIIYIVLLAAYMCRISTKLVSYAINMCYLWMLYLD